MLLLNLFALKSGAIARGRLALHATAAYLEIIPAPIQQVQDPAWRLVRAMPAPNP